MARAKTQKRASKQSKNRKKRSVFAYPLVIFLLLCAGVFLAIWTWRAGADDILVTAKVAGKPITAPAVITSPTNGVHFSSIPVTVSGTCPPNAAYVEIFDNNVMHGTAICSGSGTFQLSIDLFPGANSLVAHVFNVTDDEGPVSGTITVIYTTTQPAGSSQSPLALSTVFIYKGYHVGDQVEWPLAISGGVGPYAISVDWGDGTSDLISQAQAGEFKINHTYGQPGDYKDSYTIKVKATDSNGKEAFIQFFVIVTPKTIGQANIISKPPPSFANGLSWLWIAWPLYLIILLMVLSYKLGEREELVVLRKRGALRR